MHNKYGDEKKGKGKNTFRERRVAWTQDGNHWSSSEKVKQNKQNSERKKIAECGRENRCSFYMNTEKGKQNKINCEHKKIVECGRENRCSFYINKDTNSANTVGKSSVRLTIYKSKKKHGAEDIDTARLRGRTKHSQGMYHIMANRGSRKYRGRGRGRDGSVRVRQKR